MLKPVTQSHSHSSLLITIHWSTAISVLALVLLVTAREIVEQKAARTMLLDIHRALGMLVLALTVLRVVAKAVLGRIHFPPAARWMNCIAAAVHALLYIGLLALPCLGWVLTNAQGKAPLFFAPQAIPRWTGRNLELADQLQSWHGTLGWIFVALVVVHVAATLWHHFVLHDKTLAAMLPGSRINSLH